MTRSIITAALSVQLLLAQHPTGATTPTQPPIYANNFPSLAAALAAASNGGTLTIPDGYQARIQNSLTISANNVTVVCGKGASISSVGSRAFIITGKNSSIRGCSINTSGRGASDAVLIKGALNPVLQDNVITSTDGIGILENGGVSNARIEGNTITAAGDPIAFSDNIAGLIVRHNIITGTGNQPGSHAIMVHSAADGSTVKNILIEGNQITQGNGNFCIEVGNFGLKSTPPTGVNVSNNFCTLSTNSNGMVSLSTMNHAVMEGNIFDAQNHQVFIDAFEIVLADTVTAIGNIARNMGGGYLAPAFTINGSQNITAQGNILTGCVTITDSNAAYFNLLNDQFINNIINIPAGSASCGHGALWLQMNSPGHFARDVLIAQNHLNGIGIDGGITLENDVPPCDVIATAVDHTMVSRNFVTNSLWVVNDYTMCTSNTVSDLNFGDIRTPLYGPNGPGRSFTSTPAMGNWSLPGWLAVGSKTAAVHYPFELTAPLSGGVGHPSAYYKNTNRAPGQVTELDIAGAGAGKGVLALGANSASGAVGGAFLDNYKWIADVGGLGINLSAADVGFFDNAGVRTARLQSGVWNINALSRLGAGNQDLAGTLTIGVNGAVSYPLRGAYTAAPICLANDTTAGDPVRISATDRAVSFSGRAGDNINFICIVSP